ncbi:20635_t:CDS:2 [Gigaspora rosea]|nr:20635_t:CDS:2 [Gigaspora rosea]
MCPQITEIGETGPIVHYNQNVNNQSEMPYQNSAQVQVDNNDNLQPSSFEISSYQDNIQLQQPCQYYDQYVTNYQFQHQPRQDFNSHQNNFSTQQHIHNRSNTINQTNQTSQQNDYPQQIFYQNRELITMMQNLSNNTYTIKMLFKLYFKIHFNALPNSDINDSQNTPSDNIAINQRQESIHQINICDPCKRRNFPEEDPSTSINQIKIYQKEGGWGPNPTNPPCPWVEETNKCKWCSLDKKYCYCDSIIIWNWDDIEYGNYKWCKWCEKTNHNEREYRLMPKSPEIKSQEWKKKIKCSNCSKKYRLVYHDEEEQCPQTYEYSDPRR